MSIFLSPHVPVIQDPSPEFSIGGTSREARRCTGGADVVELGFPGSDLLADGTMIRLAAERVLARGMRTTACLDCLRSTRERVDVPLVPMTYAALLEATDGSGSRRTQRSPARPR